MRLAVRKVSREMQALSTIQFSRPWIWVSWGLILAAGLYVALCFVAIIHHQQTVESLKTRSEDDLNFSVVHNADIFILKEAFYIAHLWLAAALYSSVRDPSVLKKKGFRLLLASAAVTLVAGHLVAWWASGVGVSVGLVPWS
jgi:uncharacterized membrane protein YqhA